MTPHPMHEAIKNKKHSLHIFIHHDGDAGGDDEVNGLQEGSPQEEALDKLEDEKSGLAPDVNDNKISANDANMTDKLKDHKQSLDLPHGARAPASPSGEHVPPHEMSKHFADLGNGGGSGLRKKVSDKANKFLHTQGKGGGSHSY